MSEDKAKEDYKPRDFLSNPSGKPCPTCGAREGDKGLFGDCRVCAALFFNRNNRQLNADREASVEATGEEDTKNG